MSHKKAQTIIELAVFGSILIFILGLIIRQALSFGYIQNQNLKAMRVALATSYQYSEGIKNTGPANPRPGQGVGSRNSASIFLVEDRLSADAAKYGTIDRNPYLNAASGTFSRNLFLPVDFNCKPPQCPEEAPPPGEVRVEPPDAGETYNLPMFDVMVNGVHFPFTTSGFAEISMTDPYGIPVDGVQPNYRYYYTIVPNHPLMSEWCDRSDIECPCIKKPDVDDEKSIIIIDPLTCPKFPVERRFDLQRCGDDEDRGPNKLNKPDCSDHPIKITDPTEQETFAWQWSVIDGADLRQGSQVDLDGDLKEESVLKIDKEHNKIIYIDQQLGDVDFTITQNDKKPSPGLRDDVAMMTRTKEGTYLFINEGRLFDKYNQFVRTASKKDSIDIIQRIFQLSNDTKRFCLNGEPNNNPYIWTEDNPVKINNSRNPVEACGDCLGANIDKTCMDTEVVPPIIYIRSRVLDKHGRNWLTNEHDDMYINFQGK